MEVQVHLYSQSKPIEHIKVRNTYTKDGLFCIMYENGVVDKYPLDKIFRIKES